MEELKVKIQEMNSIEKMELLKLITSELDIIITGCYGASDYLNSENIRIATDNDIKYECGCTKDTIIITTNIMTG